MAIWCAASAAMPKVPIARVAALNRATSNSMVTPIGRPRWNSSASARQWACAKRLQEAVGAQARRAERDDRHRHQGEKVRGGAGEARAHQPQSRQAEMAEDQAVIAQRVEQDGNAHHDHRRHRPAERGGEVAQDLERQRTGQAERQCRRINSGIRRQSRLLMEQQEDVAGEEQRRQQGRRHQRHRPQAHAHNDAYLPALARLDRFGVTAHDMGDHRRDRGNRPGTQQPDEKEDGIADGAGRQRLLAEMTQHHGIGGQDDHLGELGCRHRHRQARQFARLRQPGGKAVAGDAGSGIGDVQARCPSPLLADSNDKRAQGRHASGWRLNGLLSSVGRMKTLNIAHRGGAGLRPENTLAAFRRRHRAGLRRRGTGCPAFRRWRCGGASRFPAQSGIDAPGWHFG